MGLACLDIWKKMRHTGQLAVQDCRHLAPLAPLANLITKRSTRLYKMLHNCESLVENGLKT